jgi:hypothetical protein
MRDEIGVSTYQTTLYTSCEVRTFVLGTVTPVSCYDRIIFK